MKLTVLYWLIKVVFFIMLVLGVISENHSTTGASCTERLTLTKVAAFAQELVLESNVCMQCKGCCLQSQTHKDCATVQLYEAF